MPGPRNYGVLMPVSVDSLQFTVDGRVERTWRVSPPIASLSDLIQRCLTNLGHEGWRPISHQPNTAEAVVLARVPYPAGSKLAVFGTLRFLEGSVLVLTVSGASMQRWDADGPPQSTLNRALEELRRQGWRVHRRYPSGATVVRG